jgi:hypothetical protein
MKRWLVAIHLLLYVAASAQSSTQLVFSNDKAAGVVSDISGAVVNTFRPNNIQGKPYFGEEWNKGTTYFTKGKKADSLQLQFDLTVNKIYFKRDGVILLFLDEVEAFRFYSTGEGIPGDALFRCGYPANSKYNSSHFYEVMSDGSNFHLLKYRLTKITEGYVYNAPPNRSYKTFDELYLYNASTKEIQKIKPDKKAVLKLLPTFADKINMLCQQNNWTLKTESELKQLVALLNKE